MNEEGSRPLWICHVCDAKGSGESTACSVCYKTTCAAHLRHLTIFNPQSRLYELTPVCMECAVRETLG